MIVELTKAVVAIAVILGAWLWVQAAWRRAFVGTAADDDVLAGRMSCHGCSCRTPCEDARTDTATTGDADPAETGTDRSGGHRTCA